MKTLSRIEPLPGGTRLLVTQAELRVEAGPSRGLVRPLPAGPFMIGRDAQADLPLADPAVSRRHCQVEPDGEGHRLVDLASRTGTYLDGVRIERAPLRPKAVIRLGDSLLVYQVEERALEAFRSQAASLEGLIGASLPLRDLFALVARVAPLDLPTLIRGETGTGKEALARALHTQSPRAAGPFVVVDCTQLSDPIQARSELFGHEKGAFTGADRARPGAFRRADQGTLFLDEVGELPAAIQAQLLRVLQEGELSPLGSECTHRVKVRTVSATHRDLAALVRQGRFRQDLFYRLAAIALEVPPLRDRPEDLLALVAHLLPPGLALAPAAKAKLLAHPWPGNVRELQAVLQRSAALATGPRLEARDLALDVPGSPADPGAAADGHRHLPLRQPPRPVDDARILAALAETGGNREAAAKLLRMGRSTFFRRLKELRAREPSPP